MLMYYLPGLEVSKISDNEYVERLAHLLKIREMEQKELIAKTLNRSFGE